MSTTSPEGTHFSREADTGPPVAEEKGLLWDLSGDADVVEHTRTPQDPAGEERGDTAAAGQQGGQSQAVREH